MRDNHNVNIDDLTRTQKSLQNSGNKAEVILHSSEPANRNSSRRDFSLMSGTHARMVQIKL